MSESNPGIEKTNKHYLLGVLLVVYTFNFVDRQILALLIQPIKEELLLSDTQLGFLSGIAFALFYSTLGIPIARWADRGGNRVNIIAIALAMWSGMTALCGLAINYTQLLLARIGVGIGEAGCTPPAHSLIADYFTSTERPRALSIYMLGVPFGILIGYLIGGWINEWYGWRVAFLVMGLPGVLIAIVVKLTVVEIKKTGAASHTGSDLPSLSLGQVFQILWSKPTLRHLMLAMALTSFMGYGMGQWQPAFFVRSHDMTTGELGTWLAFIVGGGGALGIYLGGWFAARFGLDNECLQLKMLAASVAITFPLSLFVYIWPNAQGALWLLIPTNIFYFMWHGPAFALVQALVDTRMRAIAAAVALLVVNLIGLGLGPQFIGLLSDALEPTFKDDSLRYALIFNSLVGLWAAIHFVLASQHIKNDLLQLKSQTNQV